MEENKYLNEEKYQKDNKTIRRLGKILLIVGIIMLLGGFVTIALSFIGFGGTISSGISNDASKMASSAFGGMGLFAIGGLLNVIGLFITGIGAILTLMSHRREITAYTTQQVMPVAKEGVEEIAPSIGKVAKEITKGVKEGLKEEK